MLIRDLLQENISYYPQGSNLASVSKCDFSAICWMKWDQLRHLFFFGTDNNYVWLDTQKLFINTPHTRNTFFSVHL